MITTEASLMMWMETKLTDSAEEKSEIIDSILLKIGTYGPKSIFIDITKRATSYKKIFDAIKRVCGFPVPGAQLIQYMCVKNSFDSSGSETFNDFYWRLRDEKIASLMTVESGITFRGRALTQDEEITPSLENQVVVDWLEGIGGVKLVKYIGHEYTKELEKAAIHDLQETIGQQEVMKSIIDRMETEEVAKLNRSQAANYGGGQRRSTQYGRNSGSSGNTGRSSGYERKWCYLCEEIKNGKEKSHYTKDCILRNKNRRKAKNFKVEVEDDRSEEEGSNDDSDIEKMEDMLQEMNNRQ